MGGGALQVFVSTFQKCEGIFRLSALQESVEGEDPVTQVVSEDGHFFPVILQELGIGLEEGNGFLHHVICTLDIHYPIEVFLFQNEVAIKGDEENDEDEPDEKLVERPELAHKAGRHSGHDEDHRDGGHVVGVGFFIHEAFRGQHGRKDAVGTGKRQCKEEVIDEKMLDQEILCGYIRESKEYTDARYAVESKHVDALHAEDEDLCGFGGGKDEKHREKEGNPAERQTALVGEDVETELVYEEGHPAHIDELDETVHAKKAAFRLVIHDARKGHIAYIGPARLKDGDGKDQKKDIGHGFAPYEMSALCFLGEPEGRLTL